MKKEKLVSVWVPVKSKRAGIVGYMEKFKTAQGENVSLPGVSRWINGPVFDLNKAEIIGE